MSLKFDAFVVALYLNSVSVGAGVLVSRDRDTWMWVRFRSELRCLTLDSDYEPEIRMFNSCIIYEFG